jgi:hypothetical protein
MISNDIILFSHIVLFYTLALSPLITDCYFKKIILILIIFLCIQYVTKYGKCGLINIERFFLKENFKNGFVYRLIKPIICYKQNIVYKNYFKLIIIYMLVLYIQLEKAGCNLNIFEDLKKMYNDIKKI